MNPYNDNIPYDYPLMPYNGLAIAPEVGGGQPGMGIDRRKKNQNMAAILVALDYYNDST